VVLNREGTRILTRGDDGAFLLWDQSSRDIRARIDISKSPRAFDGSFAGISMACFCSDSDRIAMSFFHDTRIQVWHIPVAFDTTLAPSLVLKHQPVPRMYPDDYSAAMCPDGGSRLLSLNSDGVARVWNLSAQARVGTAFDCEGEISGSCISPLGRFLAAWLQGGNVRLWRMEDRKSIPVPIADTPGVERVVFSDDDSTMVAWRGDGSAVHWKIGGNETPETVPESTNGTKLIHSTEHYVVTADKDGKVSLLDAKSGALVGTVVPRDAGGSATVVTSAAISRNAKTLLTIGKDRVARLWSLPGGTLLQTSSHSAHNVRGILIGAVSDDGTRAVTHEKNVYSWSADRREPVAELSHHLGMGPGSDTGSSVLGAVFTGGSGRVMTWAADGFVRFWDAKSGDLLKSFEQGFMELSDVEIVSSVSPDESMLFTATARPFRTPAKLWDVESGRVLRDLEAYGGNFSTDGRYLTTFGDNEIRVLDLRPASESHSAAEIARFQVRSASELTDAGQFRNLDWREWQKRKESLRALEAGSK
jgi:WD40 repeat protein